MYTITRLDIYIYGLHICMYSNLQSYPQSRRYMYIYMPQNTSARPN